MTERRAAARIEMTDDETAAVLADALAGRNLSRREARQLAAALRAVVEGLPPGTGNLAGLSRRLAAAADVLDARSLAPKDGASPPTAKPSQN